MIWNHPIEATIKSWLFGVPGLPPCVKVFPNFGVSNKWFNFRGGVNHMSHQASTPWFGFPPAIQKFQITWEFLWTNVWCWKNPIGSMFMLYVAYMYHIKIKHSCIMVNTAYIHGSYELCCIYLSLIFGSGLVEPSGFFVAWAISNDDWTAPYPGACAMDGRPADSFPWPFWGRRSVRKWFGTNTCNGI